MSANDLHCPRCRTRVGPASLLPPRRRADGFDDCVRRCDECGVGYSNGSIPTVIYRNPLDNVPREVHGGALDTLGASLNERSRESKRKRFGFETSEDAVTWTVFSWLTVQAPAALVRVGERLFGEPVGTPAVLLWGVPVPTSGMSDVRARTVEILDALGEAPRSRTEPDVMLDYGPRGLALIEVKHRAANDVKATPDATKFDRYVRATTAFADPSLATSAGHYELTRNWRLGWDLAVDRPFRLVNLGPTSLFEGNASRGLDAFEAALAGGDERAFVRLTWADFLSDIRAATGPLPTWLAEWLSHRGIPA